VPQHKTIHTTLHGVREKVSDIVHLLNADFGLVRVEGRNLLHRNRLCFLCSFLCTNKERKYCANKRKEGVALT